MQISTDCGIVKGEILPGGVSQFLRLPYAREPRDELRFAKPVRMPRWRGIRDCTGLRPAATPSRRNHEPSNVLWVNVWLPAGTRKGDDKPVMVWVPGDRYVHAEASDPLYNGAAFAAEQDVIVVAVSYRNGVDGWSEIDGCPSNRGMRDVATALEWVHDNAYALGGDASRVTVLGQSSGAGVVACLMSSPLAEGLIGRAVAMSLPGSILSMESARSMTEGLASSAGVAPTSQGFATTPAHTLVNHAVDMASSLPPMGAEHNPIIFSPVLDPDSLPESPWDAAANGRGSRIPLLLGHVSNEYSRVVNRPDPPATTITADAAQRALQALSPTPDEYLAMLRKMGFSVDPATLYTVLMGDWQYAMPTAMLAHLRTRGPSYLYNFDYVPDGDGIEPCAAHGSELPLLFNNPQTDQAQRLYRVPFTLRSARVGRAMRDDFVAFARHGEPGWPAYEWQRRSCRVFTSTVRDERHPLWRHVDHFLPQWRPLQAPQ